MKRSIEGYEVQAATDLGIAANFTTSSVYCYGAREVVFIATANESPGVAFSGASIQVSVDNANWTAAGTAAGATTGDTSSVDPVNRGGLAFSLRGPDTDGFGVVPFKYARLTGTGSVNGHVGLRVVANVVEIP